MSQCLLPLLLATSVAAAEPVFLQSFNAADLKLPGGTVVQEAGRGGVLQVSVPAGTPAPGRTVNLPLPVEKLRGQRVFFSAEVKASDVSSRPNSWNGVKVMLIIETPSGKEYPQPEIPVGSVDWQRFSSAIAVPSTATSATLVLGLEQVTGEAWFDNVRVTLRPTRPAPPPADAAQPIFRGHHLPRLRGAMAGHGLSEEDVKHFATIWNGNLMRLQIFESARQNRSLADYDTWLESQLQQIDRVLAWCEKYRVLAVVDLHSPPGGQAFSAGYVTARGRIFTDPAAQDKFVEVWQKITRRYKGRQVIWGFDLVNEPDDTMVTEDCLDWNELAEKTARAVRAIDPDRTLIIEPNAWGGPQGLAAFRPLSVPRVVYSFHFYNPHQFTHQGIHNNPGGIAYPGTVGGQRWDRDALEKSMQPAFDFTAKYRVHLYVGEFSAIRNAPGDSAARYLEDVIALLEKHGCDWSYHAYREWQGWSLEHTGPLDQPVKAQTPTDRQKVVTGWMEKNQKP
ncbi:MAG TPA: cellulase family glycosylhydrolase [Clostridia bacterium]|nr:cellulase family glycosylhydrolase [Clostridia bacterium]